MSGLMLGKHVDGAGLAHFVEVAVDAGGRVLLAGASPDAPATSGDSCTIVLAQRRDDDASSATADGNYGTIQTDEDGRLKVATKPGIFPLVSGFINAAGQSVAVDVGRASNVLVMMAAAALTGHNSTFEGSLDSSNGIDGTWFVVQAVRSNANMIETATGVLAATPVYAWELSVNGLKYFRVRATAHTGGISTWKIQRGSYATEPIPAAQVTAAQPVSGAVTVSCATAFYNDTVSPLAVGATFTGTSRDLGVTQQTKKSFLACAFSDQAGTLFVDMSNDAVTWRQAKKAAVAAGDSADLFVSVVTRYYRVRFINDAVAQTAFMLNSATQAI